MRDTSQDIYSSESRSRLIDGTMPTQESKLRTESEELMSTGDSQKQFDIPISGHRPIQHQSSSLM